MIHTFRSAFILFVITAWASLAAAKEDRERPVQTVPSVDLGRYSGKWYEVARLPTRFQRDCIGATAEYTAFYGGQAVALAAIEQFVADLNALFEPELAIHLDLVSGTNTIFTDANTDGYTNGDPDAMLSENTAILDGILGNGAYDIGHALGTTSSGGSGRGGRRCR